MKRAARAAFVILAFVMFAPAVSAQKARTVVAIGVSRMRVVNEGSRVHTLELDSRFLKRKVWLSVFLPESYFDPAQSGRRYSAIYLLHGLTGRFDNWSTKTSLTDYIKEENVIVVTPEGANGWYTDSATKPEDKFETYMVEEIIPEIDHRYRTIAEGRARAIAGLSMGGYGAIKFGLKYPGMFSLVGSFSGAVASVSVDAPGAIGKSITAVFGPPGSRTRNANDVFAIVRGLSAEQVAQLPFIYFDCGTEDPLFQSNRNFADLLLEKDVPHEFRQLPGAHNWQYWDRQVEEFLQLAAKKF